MNAKKARKLRIVVRELAGDQQEVLINEPHEIEIAVRGSDGKETGEKVKGFHFTKRHKGPRSFYKQLKKDVQESRSVQEEPAEVVENKASDLVEALTQEPTEQVAKTLEKYA